MAREPQEEEGSCQLVEGLTSDRLLSLADEMLARGVLRFSVGAVSVEFSPSVVGSKLAAEKAERAREEHERTLRAAGGLEQARRDAAKKADEDRISKAVASA